VTCLKALGILTSLTVLCLAPAKSDAQNGTPNLLVDVSAPLIDGAVRRPVDRIEPVGEVILDTPISGTSRTVGTVNAELVPDASRAVVDVVLRGCNNAKTVGTRPHVLVYTASTTPFEVRRRILIDSQGFYAVPVPAMVSTLTGLVGVTNRYGEAGTLATCFAERGFYRDKAEAEEESADKAAWRLSARMRQELTPTLSAASQAVGRGLQVLQRTGLRTKAPRFSTTATLLHGQLRLGASETVVPPAPALPAEMDLGLRVHQSLLNEAARAAFGGKSYRLDELRKWADELTRIFVRPSAPSDGTRALQKLLTQLGAARSTVKFARLDPVVVTFTDMGFTIEIHLATIRIEETEYPGARLRAIYRLENTSSGVNAARVGPLQIFAAGDGKKAAAPPAPLALLLEASLGADLGDRLVLADLAVLAAFAQVRLLPPRVDARAGWLTLTWKMKS
jgi:hypothetical protein